MADDDDARLMQRAAGGDRVAFERLFDRHQRSVVRFCARFVGVPARAEELAQEVFIKLYRSAGSYSPTAQFKTFLFRIATNHCLNELRRGEWKREQQDAAADEGPSLLEQRAGGDMPDEALEGRQLEAAVTRAMRQMSERERAAFTMCRFEGMAYRDIAATLEASEAAVKSLIHRATLQVMQHVEAVRAGLATPGSTGSAAGRSVA